MLPALFSNTLIFEKKRKDKKGFRIKVWDGQASHL